MDRLRTELGDDLVSVWLYGSRARGEAPHPESDIDLLVLIREGDWRRERHVAHLAWEAVDAAGANEGRFSVFVHTPEWLRDKVALHGDP